jgi:hypothetical protein
MRSCASPASHAAWCLRSPAGHQPATTPRPVHRSTLACTALLFSHLSMPQCRCRKGDGTPTALASGCAHVAIPCAMDMVDHGHAGRGGWRRRSPRSPRLPWQYGTQERVCVRGRWRATLGVTARYAPPVDALTTPLAGSPSRSICRSLGAHTASMGAHGVITARQQLAGRTVTAHAVLASAAHLSVQPSRAPALEALLACQGCLSTPPAPAKRSCIFGLVQSPLAGHKRRENACRTSPSDAWASHKFSRRRNRRLLCTCARWSKNSGRWGNHQGTALRPRSMVDRLQNFQRACFRIARVVHLHTGGQIRVQVWRGSLGSFRQRRL